MNLAFIADSVPSFAVRIMVLCQSWSLRKSLRNTKLGSTSSKPFSKLRKKKNKNYGALPENEYRGDWERFGFLDLESRVEETTIRAYSMANYPDEKGRIMLNVRIATPPSANVPPGKMSSYIFNLKAGDKVTISGPFGEFFV